MQTFEKPKPFLLIVLLIIFNLAGSAQRKKDFSIPATDQKISGSHYHQISFIEARADTMNMGFVQMGMMNEQANIYFKIPFREQLSNLMSELTDKTAQSNILYFQLRKFSLSELTGSYTETGSFHFRAALYRKSGQRFIRINQVDTVLRFKASGFGDVTKTLLLNSGTEIVQFVKQGLLRDGVNDSSYSLTEIENPDSVEKSHITLYTTSQYTDGLYLTYQSFSK